MVMVEILAFGLLAGFVPAARFGSRAVLNGGARHACWLSSSLSSSMGGSASSRAEGRRVRFLGRSNLEEGARRVGALALFRGDLSGRTSLSG